MVLRAGYVAKTVIALLAGAEGGAAPALTQTDGTTWEYSLAQVSITTGGVITLTDERDILPVNGPRTRTFLVDGMGNNVTDGGALSLAAYGQTMPRSQGVQRLLPL